MPQPNFPDSPTVNQEYTYSGSTWVWTGQYWRVQQAPSTNNNFIPAANVAYDLGSANQRWRDLYLAGNTMYIGAAALSSSGSGLNLPAGSTVGGTAVASTADVVSTITTSVVKIGNIQVTGNTFVPLDDTAVDTAGGFIKINGAGFVAGCSVIIGSQSASAVSFISVTALGVTVPALSAGTYTVYVTNPDGSVAIRVNGLNINGVPSWTTAAGLTDQFIDSAISIQLTANSNSTVSYTLQGGSSLPPGITLSNVGLLSGTVTGLVADTTYTFTVVATDQENQDTPRTFTVTIVTVQQIARSLRFNSADSAYLNRTPAVAGSRTTWTWSAWVKRAGLYTTNAGPTLFDAGPDNGNFSFVRFLSDNQDRLDFGWVVSGSMASLIRSNASFRDPSSWYHIVAVLDTNNATSTDRMRLYVNGQRITSFLTTSYPAQGTATCHINATNVHYLGRSVEPLYRYMNDYMAEVNLIDGQALTPASFGRTDLATGTWVPMRYTGTYGTNGFYLNFANNASTSSLGVDSSGNNNTWTLNNFSVTAGTGNDSLIDSPSSYGSDTGIGGEVRGSYCVLNVLAQNTSVATISDGALRAVTGTSGVSSAYMGTIGFSSGKWYWEVYVEAVGTNNMWIGVTKNQAHRTVDAYTNTWTYNKLGQKTDNSATGSAYGAAYTTGDTIGVAVDADIGSITFYKNGASQGVAFTGLTMSGGVYTIGGSDNSAAMVFNYGQRPFAYAAPATYKALNTANLPVPTIGLGAQNQARSYFDVITYTGNGSTQTITGLQFQPDLVWIKRRDSNWSNAVYDSIRGAGSLKALSTNGTDAEGVFNADTTYGYLSSFNGNGFTVINGTTGGYTNLNGATYVAWCWRAGGNAVVNTAGTIQSNVSVNTTAGFSIARYTGTGVSASFGHGLGVVPKLVIIKSLGTEDWFTYVGGILGGSPPNYLKLNTTAAAGPSSGIFPSLATSSVVNIGSGSGVGANGVTHIAYSFAEVPGFSAFGSYTGNGSADGPFIYTGFRPRWLLIRRSDTIENWNITDTARDPFNIVSLELYPNLTNVEAGSAASYRDFLSNGFKIRGTGGGFNTTGGTYIYAAFAETPVKYTRSR